MWELQKDELLGLLMKRRETGIFCRLYVFFTYRYRTSVHGELWFRSFLRLTIRLSLLSLPGHCC